MRERRRLLHGPIAVHSEKDKGTRVEVLVSLAAGLAGGREIPGPAQAVENDLKPG